MLAGQLAIVSAAVFTGAAIYVGVVEHPARMRLDDRSALSQWKPAYARGAAMQAPLAILGFLFGVVAWWSVGDWPWLAGALILVANWPYTLLVIMSVNQRLKSIDPAAAGAESRGLLGRWARLHAVRAVLGAAATLSFTVASLGGG